MLFGVALYPAGDASLARPGAFATIERKIRANVARVLTLARERALLPREAAVALATERVAAAMGYGRWR